MSGAAISAVCRRSSVTAALVAAVLIATLGLCAIAVGDAAAQGYPDRTIRLVVGVPAGSSADVHARLVAEAMDRELGQRVIVDNRPGADGIIAVRQVTTAAPDGYTLLFGLGSQLAINPATFASLPYDPERDLVPITLLSYQTLALVVTPSLPVATPRELVDYSRARPGSVNYGTGTSTFMIAAEAFKLHTGADLTHIPFNGSSATLNAVVGGTVQVSFSPSIDVMSLAKAGKVRVLAVTSNARLAQLPDVPTYAETGLPNEVPVWTGLFAPAGTPAAVVERLRAAAVAGIQSATVRERLESAGDSIVGSRPAELAAVVARDLDATRALVKRIGLPPR